MSSSQGILFLRNENEVFKWFEHGDEDMDGKYVGEIEYGEPNGQGTYTLSDGYKYEGEWKDGMNMVKDLSLYLMERCMRENLRKDTPMVKEQKLILLGELF